jgi:uncharacterized damage-inducible protein DinB
MGMIDAFLQEWESEAKTTRRVLERVPDKHLSWKPHAKSMSLGQLALHIAQSPGFIANWALGDQFEFTADMGKQAEPKTNAEILQAHDEGSANVRKVLAQVGDAGLLKMWKGVAGGATVMEMPKVGLVRVVVLNHTYHHRGQLSVYLRLLDVPVPSIYGPSADENRVTAEPANQ